MTASAVLLSVLTSCGAATDAEKRQSGAGRGDADGGATAGKSSASGKSGAGSSSSSAANGGTAGKATNARAGGSAGAGAELGDAGASGTDSAGAGGEGCAPSERPACDDHESCTSDRLDGGCKCTHVALADGSACDDQNVCTDDDTCNAGLCAGTARASVPAVVGTLRGFGQAPGLQTLVAFPSQDRAVFAQSKRLTLVGLDGDKAAVLDDIAMGAPVLSDSVSSMIWVSRPRTFLLPVLEHHLAVVSSGWGIDLFDLSGDKLTPSERYGFNPGAPAIRGAAGAGSHLFTCTANTVQAWSIDPSTELMSLGPSVSLPGGQACLGLALSPDENTLYAATNGALERIDVSAADSSLLLLTHTQVGALVADVQAAADYVAVYEIRDASSGFGDVLVLAPDTLAVVATFAADLSPHGNAPVGFSLLDGARLLLQTLHTDQDGCEVGEATIFALSSTPVELDRTTTFHACESPFITPSYHTVARGRHAVLEPMHQLVTLDTGSGKIANLPSPRQGTFESVRASGQASVLAYGAGSTQRIDISDPTTPDVSAGGPVSPLDLEWLELELSDPLAPAFVTADTWADVSGPVTTILQTEADGAPQAVGSIRNDDSAGIWSAADSTLYQLSAKGTRDFELRRFAAADIAPASAQTLSPESQQTLSTDAPAELDVRQPPLFRIDAANGDLIVLEPRYQSSVGGSDVPVISAFSLNHGHFERLFSRALGTGTARSLVSAGGRSVVWAGANLWLVDRSGNAQDITPVADSSELALEGALFFDAQKLVLAAAWSSPTKTEGVVVLQSDDFSEIARYPTPESVSGFAEAGGHLIFGSRSSLTVATPACTVP